MITIIITNNDGEEIKTYDTLDTDRIGDFARQYAGNDPEGE